MRFLEVLGLLLISVILLLIDKPRLKAVSDKAKCTLTYCVILVAVLLLGTLEIFNLLPTFNGMLVELYERYSVK